MAVPGREIELTKRMDKPDARLIPRRVFGFSGHPSTLRVPLSTPARFHAHWCLHRELAPAPDSILDGSKNACLAAAKPLILAIPSLRDAFGAFPPL